MNTSPNETAVGPMDTPQGRAQDIEWLWGQSIQFLLDAIDAFDDEMDTPIERWDPFAKKHGVGPASKAIFVYPRLHQRLGIDPRTLLCYRTCGVDTDVAAMAAEAGIRVDELSAVTAEARRATVGEELVGIRHLPEATIRAWGFLAAFRPAAAA